MEVEREVLPIVSQCLDCMEKSAESIDEKEVSANNKNDILIILGMAI